MMLIETWRDSDTNAALALWSEAARKIGMGTPLGDGDETVTNKVVTDPGFNPARKIHGPVEIVVASAALPLVTNSGSRSTRITLKFEDVRSLPQDAKIYAVEAAIKRLRDISRDPDEQVNEEAERAASLLLLSAMPLLASFPRPLIGVDEEGSVGMTWRNASRTVRAIFAPSRNASPYLFIREGNQHRIIPDVTPLILAEQIAWLTNP